MGIELARNPLQCGDLPAQCANHTLGPRARRAKDTLDVGRAAELPRGDQGHRGRRGWLQRGQPHDRRRAEGRRVHLGEHGRAVVAHERRRREAGHRARDHPRPGRRIGPGDRPPGGRGPPRRDRGGAEGRRHGVHHPRRGWRHRHRRGAGGGRGRQGGRRAHHRHRHPPVQLRGSPAWCPGRERHPEDPREGRHADRHPERPPAHGGRRTHVDAQRVQDVRRGPAPGCAGHHRPHHHARSHQHRLRRRAHDHEQRGQRAHGHRLRVRRRSRGERGACRDLQPDARGERRRCARDVAQRVGSVGPRPVRGERSGGDRGQGRAPRRQHHLRRGDRRQPRRRSPHHRHRRRLRSLRRREATVARA